MNTETPPLQTEEFGKRLQDLPSDTPRAVQAVDWMRVTVVAFLTTVAIVAAIFTLARILSGGVSNPAVALIIVGALLVVARGLVVGERRTRANRMSFVANANSYAIYRGDELAEILPRERIVYYQLSLHNTFVIASILAFIPIAALVVGIRQADLTLIITGLVGGALCAAFLHRRLICRWILITGRIFDKQIALDRKGSEIFW